VVRQGSDTPAGFVWIRQTIQRQFSNCFTSLNLPVFNDCHPVFDYSETLDIISFVSDEVKARKVYVLTLPNEPSLNITAAVLSSSGASITITLCLIILRHFFKGTKQHMIVTNAFIFRDTLDFYHLMCLVCYFHNYFLHKITAIN